MPAAAFQLIQLKQFIKSAPGRNCRKLMIWGGGAPSGIGGNKITLLPPPSLPSPTLCGRNNF